MFGRISQFSLGLRKLSYISMLVVFIAGILFSQSAAATPEPFRIELSVKHNGISGHYAVIDITKVTGSGEVAGFDFRIRYNSQALTFLGMDRGEIFDIPGSHEWEAVKYELDGGPQYTGNKPYRTLEINGTADRAGDAHQPVDLNIPDGSVLASLSFMITYHEKYECWFIPIEFYWLDCEDNVIITADTLNPMTMISDNVYDRYDNNITDYNTEFPTIHGAPDICINTSTVRQIDFKSGGIDVACIDGMGTVGDLNLNGHPYEVSDAVVYYGYFCYGIIFFAPWPPEEVIAQSDVNRDGVALSVADLVFLIRIITGAVLPYP